MNIDQFRQYFPGVQITPEQLACCRFLEREELRFCIDFGYQDAQSLTWQRIDPVGDSGSFDYDPYALNRY